MKLGAFFIGFMMILGLNPVEAQQNLYVDTFSSIKSIQISSQGSVFVLDGDKSTLSRYKLEDGKFEFSVGSVGFGANRFDQANDLQLNSGLKLLLTDSGNQRIVQYDRNLQFLGEITAKNAHLMNGWEPVQALALGTGEIWVLDALSKQLFLFDENGLFRTVSVLPRDCNVGEKSRLFLVENELIISNLKQGVLFKFSVLGKYEQFLKVDKNLKWLGFHQSNRLQINDGFLESCTLNGAEIFWKKKLPDELNSEIVIDIKFTRNKILLATSTKVYLVPI